MRPLPLNISRLHRQPFRLRRVTAMINENCELKQGIFTLWYTRTAARDIFSFERCNSLRRISVKVMKNNAILRSLKEGISLVKSIRIPVHPVYSRVMRSICEWITSGFSPSARLSFSLLRSYPFSASHPLTRPAFPDIYAFEFWEGRVLGA